jgi:hypothetical protein
MPQPTPADTLVALINSMAGDLDNFKEGIINKRTVVERLEEGFDKLLDLAREGVMSEDFNKYLPLWRGEDVYKHERYWQTKEKISAMLRNLGLHKEADLIQRTFAQRTAAAYGYPKS